MTKLCVKELCVTNLSVTKLCVKELCVTKLCVTKLCVKELCATKLCVCGKIARGKDVRAKLHVGETCVKDYA